MNKNKAERIERVEKILDKVENILDLGLRDMMIVIISFIPTLIVSYIFYIQFGYDSVFYIMSSIIGVFSLFIAIIWLWCVHED